MAEVNEKRSIGVSDGALIPDRAEKSLFSAWRISFFGALILLGVLPLISPDPFWEIIKFIPDGILRTFQVTVLSIFFALIMGLFCSVTEHGDRRERDHVERRRGRGDRRHADPPATSPGE